MLRGVDVRKFYKTPVEVFVLHQFWIEEAKEHLKMRLLLEASLLNRNSAEEITKFNNLLNEYYDLLNPEKVKSRTDFTKKAEKLLKRLTNLRYTTKSIPEDISKKLSSPLSLKSKALE